MYDTSLLPGILASSADIDPSVRMFSTLAVGGILLAGIIKCISIMRRPTTNTLCVLSLMFALVVWMTSVIAGQLLPNEGAGYLAIKIAIGILMIGLTLAALVLAIIGLVQYGSGAGRWVQGRAQAIWGLILSPLLFLGVSVGLAAGLSNAGQQLDMTSASGDTQHFESREFNFKVDTPDGRWVKMPASTINPDAAIAFRRTRPEVIWIVIAEKTGAESPYGGQTLVEFVKANLLSESPDAVFSNVTPMNVKGIEGYHMTSLGKVGGNDGYFDYWVAEHNGYAYQLITVGAKPDKAAVNKAAKAYRRSFTLIDPDKVYYLAAEQLVASLGKPEYGYRAQLPGGAWQQWEGWETDVPDSVDRMMLGSTGAFTVVTMPLDGITATDRDLIAAFFENFDFTYPDKDLRDAGRIKASGAQGYAFEATRIIDGYEYIYRFHVLKNKYRAYLLGGWALKQHADQIKLIESAMRSFEFSKPTNVGRHDQQVARAEADLLNRVGLRAFNDSRYENAVNTFKAAVDLDPGQAVYVANVINALDSLGRYEQSIAYAEQHLAKFPEDVDLRVLYAFQLGRLIDRYEDACKVYESVYASGYDDPNYFTDYIATLQELQRYEQGLDELDRFEFRHPDKRLPISRARLLRAMERYGDAINVVEAARGDGPINEALIIELAMIHLEAGQYRQAVAVVDELIQIGYATADVYYLKGEAETGLEWYRRAKQSFAKSYELSANPGTKEYLDYVSSVLGEGDNTLVRNPIDPVPVPKPINDAMVQAETKSWQPPADIDAYDLSYSLGYYFKEGEPLRSTRRRIIKVANQAGVENFSTISFVFDGQAESMYVNKLEIRDQSGQVIARGELDSYYVVDTDQDEMGTDDKTLMIPVPGLVPGCELHYEVTTTGKGNAESFPFDQYYDLTFQPRRYAMIYVTGDVDKLAYRHSAGLEPVRSRDAIGWLHQNTPIFVWESYQPNLDSWLDILTINAKEKDWLSLGREYLDYIEHRLKVPKRVVDLATSQAEPSADPEQKINALATYVRDTLSYTAIEFGTRGRMPNTTEQILTNKYGDCKDHALLLWQLLKASGINAHLALVNTMSDPVLDLPSLDQFDHMVVYVPEVAGGQLIDCTSKSCPIIGTLPPGLADKQLLILDHEKSWFIKTEPGSVTDSVIDSISDLSISPEGNLQINQTLTMTGWHAISMRSYLKPDTPDDRLRNIESLLQPYGSPRLHQFEASGIDSPAEPLVLTLNYQIDGVFDTVDNKLIGRLPAMWERYYIEPPAMASRATPFELARPLQMNCKTRIKLPDGWQFTTPRPEQNNTSPYYQHHFSEKIEDGQLISQSNVECLTGRHSPETYDAYVKSASDLLRTARGPIHMTKP